MLERSKPPSPAYTWRLTHSAWNLLRRIEQGNTSYTAPKDAHALRSGHKIAVWWEEPDPAVPSCWYTAKVIDPPTKETLSTPLNMTETIQYTRTISCPATSKMPSARAHAGHLPSRHTPHPAPNVGPPPGAAQAPRQVDSATPVIRARLRAHAATRPHSREPAAPSPESPRTQTSGSRRRAH